MISITITDRQTAAAIDRQWLRELARHVLAAQKIANAQISVALVDNQTIHDLNRRFLEHDFPTDVLTFPLGTRPLQAEIVISVEYAQQQCREYRWPAQMEAGLYLVHGLLHLCGYKDKKKADYQKMKQRQEQLLREYAERKAAKGNQPR